MGSKKRGRVDVDGGGFIAVPTAVLKSAAFINLSYSAKSMLFELIVQLSLSNNGFLRATLKMLKPRGWSSQDTITRALKELEETELIFKTHQGGRPNRASLFAVTWTALHPSPKFDPGAHRAFRRGAWQGRELHQPIIIVSPITGSTCTDSRINEQALPVGLRQFSE